MRPLYLDSAEGTTVALDGPALRVRQPERADRLFPLARVSRIVVSGAPEWQTAALLACAGRGITVTFLDHQGTPLGRLLGRMGDRQGLQQRLLDLLDRPDWRVLYAQWLRAMRQRWARTARPRLHAPGSLHTVSQLSDWVEHEARVLAGDEAGPASGRWLRADLSAAVSERLVRTGLDTGSELFQDGHPDLVTDLVEVLRWELEPVRLGWLRRRWQMAQRKGQGVIPPPRKVWIALFERNRQTVGLSIHRLTDRLRLWLTEIA